MGALIFSVLRTGCIRRGIDLIRGACLLALLGSMGTRAQAADLQTPAYYFMMVYNNPVAGREQEYDQWYLEHVPEVLQRPGFTLAQRYAAIDSELGPPPRRFVTLYQIVTNDIAGFYRGFGPPPAAGSAPPNPGPIDMATNINVTYQTVGTPVMGSAGKGEADAAERDCVFVLSTPTSTHDRDYARWYARDFDAHVRSLPGVISAQHFVLSASQQFDHHVDAAPDLVLYTVRARDFESLSAALRARWLQGPPHAAIGAYAYRPLGSQVAAPARP